MRNHLLVTNIDFWNALMQQNGWTPSQVESGVDLCWHGRNGSNNPFSFTREQQSEGRPLKLVSVKNMTEQYPKDPS